jgi:type I site-specific restriction endonuclease
MSSIKMPRLSFPDYNFSLVEKKGKMMIFDPARKRLVRLTPEEWVRQHMIRYLHDAYHYPISHMAVERSLVVNRMTKRADILIYDRDLKPSVLVECKAPEVPIRNETFVQVSAYNIACKVPWLMVTNGIIHYMAWVDHAEKKILFTPDIPHYQQLHLPPDLEEIATNTEPAD